MMRYLKNYFAFVFGVRRFATKGIYHPLLIFALVMELYGPAVASVELGMRANTLPPLAHTIFCLQYPVECTGSDAAAAFFLVSAQQLETELSDINRRVNLSIQPIRTNDAGTLGDRWLLSPLVGNCNDYAVSKRHELLRLGWPSWALLLAEVKLKTGEHHLVLVANARFESFVLDNLSQEIVPLTAEIEYQWIRIESGDDPKLWITFGSR
jgi:predicted transglutaminase-like cysteine proteinase